MESLSDINVAWSVLPIFRHSLLRIVSRHSAHLDRREKWGRDWSSLVFDKLNILLQTEWWVNFLRDSETVHRKLGTDWLWVRPSPHLPLLILSFNTRSEHFFSFISIIQSILVNLATCHAALSFDSFKTFCQMLLANFLSSSWPSIESLGWRKMYGRPLLSEKRINSKFHGVGTKHEAAVCHDDDPTWQALPAITTNNEWSSSHYTYTGCLCQENRISASQLFGI